MWLDSDLSLSELSRRLGSSSGPVQRKAAALGLPSQRPGSLGIKLKASNSKVSSGATFAQKRRGYRDLWLQAWRERPESSAHALRESSPGVYAWLYLNDRAWMNRNKPSRRHRKEFAPRVDWEQRDAALARQLREVALGLLSLEQPVRLTRNRLAVEAGIGGVLNDNLDKLPECGRVLLEVTETPEEFAVRRIRITIV